MQIVIHEMRQHQVAGSNIQVPLESTVKELVVRVDIDSAEREGYRHSGNVLRLL